MNFNESPEGARVNFCKITAKLDYVLQFYEGVEGLLASPSKGTISLKKNRLGRRNNSF